MKNHDRTWAPFQRSCRTQIKYFPEEDIAEMHALHEELVQCVVPVERLYKFCITCDYDRNKTWGDLLPILKDFPLINVHP